VERYGEFLVSQVYSGAAVGLLPALYDTLERELAPRAIYEQRRFRSLAGEAPRGAAVLVRGVAAPPEVEVSEGDLRFAVDVSAPLSTGLFPDLREGRRSVGRWSADRRV